MIISDGVTIKHAHTNAALPLSGSGSDVVCRIAVGHTVVLDLRFDIRAHVRTQHSAGLLVYIWLEWLAILLLFRSVSSARARVCRLGSAIVFFSLPPIRIRRLRCWCHRMSALAQCKIKNVYGIGFFPSTFYIINLCNSFYTYVFFFFASFLCPIAESGHCIVAAVRMRAGHQKK